MKSRDKHPALRHFHHVAQSIPVFFFYGLFACLPFRIASAVGGWLGRTLGPLWGITRRAEKNIAYVWPETTLEQRRAIVREMWDNLGRNAAEAPHLRAILHSPTTTISGSEHVQAAKAAGKPVIFLTGHFANWEVGPGVAMERLDTPLTVIYRQPNNPYADWLVRYIRRHSAHSLLAKGPEGGRGLLQALRKGQSVGLLVDQKMNGGIESPLLGKPAMTASAPAILALKTGAVLLPVCIHRERGFHMHVDIQSPLHTRDTLRFEEQVADLTQQMNERLGDFITRHPGQWLWLHRRWGRI